ncbi:MAG: hypothetical protein AB7S65_09290 [Sulfuricurvum sp.]
MAKKNFLQNIEKVKNSAAMSERETGEPGEKEKKKKLITIPVEWEEKIRKLHGGTLSAYILIALQERMQRDGLL